MNIKKYFLGGTLFVSVIMSGCKSMPLPEKLSCIIAGIGGGLGGYFLAKETDDWFIKTFKIKPEEVEKTRRAYITGMTIAFAGIGCVAGSSIYKSLSEAGIKEREKALLKALQSGAPQAYTDPETKITGDIKITEKSTQDGKQCSTIEDSISRDKQTDSIIQMHCMNPKTGAYEPVMPSLASAAGI